MVRHGRGECYKIVGFDHVTQVLEESMATVGLIMSSQYVRRHQAEVDELQERFNLIFDTIEQWKECQRNLLYLESIFASGDIRR